MIAQELMRTHVVTISPEATMGEIVDILDLYQVIIVPVVDDENVFIGSIFEDQVLGLVLGYDPAALIDEKSRVDARDRAGRSIARDIMVPRDLSVDERDDVLDALVRMDQSGRMRLPVTAGGKLIGTISRVDICQALLEGEL